MNKPAIHLYTTDAHLHALAEICAGLEEEGVPWKLLQVETPPPSGRGISRPKDEDATRRGQDAPSIERNASHWDGAVETLSAPLRSVLNEHPLDVQHRPLDDQRPSAKELAYQAAQDSVLEVGIGLTAEAIALQIRRVPKEKPVFYFANPTKEQCRILGTNAARAVKKQRFAEIQ